MTIWCFLEVGHPTSVYIIILNQFWFLQVPGFPYFPILYDAINISSEIIVNPVIVMWSVLVEHYYSEQQKDLSCWESECWGESSRSRVTDGRNTGREP